MTICLWQLTSSIPCTFLCLVKIPWNDNKQHTFSFNMYGCTLEYQEASSQIEIPDFLVPFGLQFGKKMDTKLKRYTTFHPHIDGKKKVVNRRLV
jgi:hypothetical protein